MRKLIFKNQNNLQEYFKKNNLYLSNGSTLIIYDDIELENNITFNGQVKIGKQNKIYSNSSINNTILGSDNIVKQNSIINNSKILNKNLLGPNCFIRDCQKIGNENIIGNCVEIVRSKLLNKIKISHQSFIADADINQEVIIGAGVITANFMEGKINKVYFGKNSFIGCNTTIIAPCKIGKDSIIAAGSVLNFNVKKNTKVIQKKSTTRVSV